MKKQHFPTIIVDGGYLTWVHGTSPGGNWGGWSSKRHRYIGHLVILDQEPLWRAKVYPDYKGKRAEKNLKDPLYAAKRLQVKSFRSILEDDAELNLIRYPAMEADDVMAIFHMLYHPGRIISLDKDMFQVPGFKNLMVDHKGISIAEGSYLRPRFPQYVEQHKVTHLHPSAHHVLIQCLLGDKSDSIPRLFPSHPGQAKELWTEITDSVFPFSTAYQIFKEDFIRNLLLILIPSPMLFTFYDKKAQEHPSLLFSLIERGEYWNKQFIREDVKLWAKNVMLETRTIMKNKRSRQKNTSLVWSDVLQRAVIATLA